MPAAASSPIGPAIGQLLAAARALGRDGAGILPLLAAFPDPRARRGVRHRVAVILGLAVCAVLAGARSFVAIAEWAADADEATLHGLGVTGAVPRPSPRSAVCCRAWTLMRWTTRPARGRSSAPPLRGAAAGCSRSTARRCADPARPGASAGRAGPRPRRGPGAGRCPGEDERDPLFATLLDRIDLAGAVVTADAMHAQRGHAEYLAGQRRADYLITVKRNQPGLHAQLAGLPWRQIPAADIQRDRGHGRAERRSLKVTAVAAGIAFPHAAQAIQVMRRRRPLNGKNSRKWSTETACAVTSMTVTQASPAQLADFLRGHWSIEDSLHWVRDVTLGEDSSQIRTRNCPRVMAALPGHHHPAADRPRLHRRRPCATTPGGPPGHCKRSRTASR